MLTRSTGYSQATVDPGHVAAPIPAYLRMKSDWLLMDDVSSGTDALRNRDLLTQEMGGTYLLKFPQESREDYQFRVEHGASSGRYRRIERLLASMLIRNDPQVEDVMDVMEEHVLDLDMRGKNISRMVYSLARNVLRYGHAGVLVSSDSSGRPFWAVYKPDRILGWRFGEKKGSRKLQQLRLEEHVQIPVGDYGVQTVRQIRVLSPGGWVLYRERPNTDNRGRQTEYAIPYGLAGGKFDAVESGRIPFAEIPFAVAYSEISDDEMVSSPPLKELAEASAALYSVTANRRQLLSLCAAPTLAIIGRDIEETSHKKMGPTYVINLHQGSDCKWLETSGVSFKALEQQAAEIERDIDTLGMASVVSQKMGAETAASKALDHIDGSTVMSVVSQNLERCVNNCLRYHAMFLGQAEPPWGRASLDRDFASMKLTPQEITSLLQVHGANILTPETVLKLLKDGYVLPSGFDVETELKKLEEMKMQAMAMAVGELEDDEDDEDEAEDGDENEGNDDDEKPDAS